MVNPIPNFARNIWGKWNIQGVVILSLTMQVVLIFIAPFRKRSRNKLLVSLLWFTYLVADATADFCVGLISSKYGDKDTAVSTIDDYLRAFWAPFLLLHLGGPDTITAFSLEDNELWLRHMLGLTVQATYPHSLPHHTSKKKRLKRRRRFAVRLDRAELRLGPRFCRAKLTVTDNPVVIILNIPTKINKGTVEIITPVELIRKGEKVGSSEAALLAKLGIRPYGLVVLSVYDNGSVFSPEVLDLTEDDLIEKFVAGVSIATSLSLAISSPNI